MENDSAYLSILQSGELEVIKDADGFLSRPLPAQESDRGIYAFHNIRFQNELNKLRANVLWAKHNHDNRLKQRENVLRSSAREDKIGDKDERDVMRYKDTQWRDLNNVSQRLKIIVDRINTMEWMLKSHYEFVSSRRNG